MMMLEQKTHNDQELFTLLQSDGHDALEQIYNKYWRQLYLAAFSILRDDAACQDIVQEVLLQLWIRKNEIIVGSLRSYLFMAIRYKVLSYIKSANNRKVFLEPGELERLAGVEEMKDRLDEKDINSLLDLGISALPKRCQQIFVLSRKENLSNKEIAERLGITVKAVEAQITIALKQLRLIMGDFLFWACIVLPLFFKA